MKMANKSVEQAWKDYIEQKNQMPETDSRLRTPILQSWKRSLAKSCPYNGILKYISSSELQHQLKEYQLLTTGIMRHIVQFQDLIKRRNLQLIFTDPNGTVLLSVDAKNTGTAIANIKPGAILNEESTGTTAISICLAENTAYYTTGYENYNEVFHQCAFYDAPLHVQSNITGTLCCISEDDYDPVILELLQHSVNALETEIRLHALNQVFNTTIDSLSQGIVVLNQNGEITYINQMAEKMIEDTDAKGKSIYDYVDKESIPECLLINDSVEQLNCQIRNTSKKSLDLIVTKKKLSSPDFNYSESILIVQPQEHIHEQISKAAGFVATQTFESIAGTSALMKSCIASAKTLAKTDANVLLTGETGVGKEVFAQAIHNASSRNDKPFVTISCNSLSGTSAFNSASMANMFELAKEGTLYLDNVESLPPEAQQLLSNILGNHTYTRIISATSKNLQVMVINHEFSSDLYYQLNILSLTIPPLREHPSDIKEIINRLLQSKNIKEGYQIDPKAMQALMKYPWPGNIRELENVVERIITLHPNGNISILDLPENITGNYYAYRYSSKVQTDPKLSVMVNEITSSPVQSPDMKEYNLILEALEKEKGNVQTAAELLHMPASTLYRKLRRYNIRAKEFKQW